MAAKSDKQQQEDRKDTERVVLQAIPMTIDAVRDLVPDDSPIREALKGKDGKDTVQLWVELGRATGDKRKVCVVASKDKPGDFRAPSVSSWKGGLRRVLPEQPRLEDAPLD
jgi:hypothetical protein